MNKIKRFIEVLINKTIMSTIEWISYGGDIDVFYSTITVGNEEYGLLIAKKMFEHTSYWGFAFESLEGEVAMVPEVGTIQLNVIKNTEQESNIKMLCLNSVQFPEVKTDLEKLFSIITEKIILENNKKTQEVLSNFLD